MWRGDGTKIKFARKIINKQQAKVSHLIWNSLTSKSEKDNEDKFEKCKYQSFVLSL